jgi:Protein of unknown function (DUF3891)
MIRRAGTNSLGPTWLLIGQQAHARLAAELAADWAAAPRFGAGALPEQLVAAVAAHDDGWPEWDVRPEIDPARGVPYDFTEMPVADALAIWRGSIRAADALGPVAAWITSAHFTALLERYRGWERSSPASVELARRFLAEQELARERWRRQAASAGVPEADLAEQLCWLQLFDAVSLWLCCRELESPLRVEPPGQASVEFVSQGPLRVACRPWPFRVAEGSYGVAAREVRATFYEDADALARAASLMLDLRWTLSPIAAD